MPIFNLTVPGKPIAQARPRIVNKGKYYGLANIPESTNYRIYCRLMAVQIVTEQPDDYPINEACKMTITIYVNKPASWTKSHIYADTKPDIDNFVKQICDSLDGVVYTNDSRIVELHVYKKLDDVARVEITVEPMEN